MGYEKKTWIDDGKRKFSYERYYAIDDKKNSDSNKGWVNGRVMNPFCSKGEDVEDGIVTSLRVYCFDSEYNRCSDLKPEG